MYRSMYHTNGAQEKRIFGSVSPRYYYCPFMTVVFRCQLAAQLKVAWS